MSCCGRICSMALILTLTGLFLGCARSPVTQPTIRSKSLETLTLNGHSFKDLNKNGQLDPYEDWRLPVADRVEDLISRMTLEEQAGMMMHPLLSMGENGQIAEHPGTVTIDGREVEVGLPTTHGILQRKITHFNVYESGIPAMMATWNNNVQALAEKSRLAIPVTLSSNVRQNYRDRRAAADDPHPSDFSRWPEPIGLAAIGDPAIVEEFGAIANQEFRAVGIRTVLHPMATLATTQAGVHVTETFGADAATVASMVAAYIRGFQGENISPSSVSCVTKHFPGHDLFREDLTAERASSPGDAGSGARLEEHLLPFQAAIRAGTAQIMPYDNMPGSVNGAAGTTGIDKEVITGLLRDQLGFTGAVCTDWFLRPTEESPGAGQTLPAERYLQALEAGVDQFGGESHPEVLVELVNQGKIPLERITTSVRRLLHIKFRLGLFENPYVDSSWASQVCGNLEFQESADLAQRKSIVLLKNDTVRDKTILPLSATTKVYVEGLDPELLRAYGTVVNSLSEADVAVLRIRAASQQEEDFFRQIASQPSPASESRTLEHVRQVLRTKPTVVTFFLDHPAAVPEIVADSAALLVEFGAADEALLDVIFGKFRPTGKLPFNLLASSAGGRRTKEGRANTTAEPLFRFGHGLSY